MPKIDMLKIFNGERYNKMWEGDVSMCVVGVFTDEYDIYKKFSFIFMMVKISQVIIILHFPC